MERMVGHVEYREEIYEVMYNTNNADACCRKEGSMRWLPCSMSSNDDWHIKKNVLDHLSSRDNGKYRDTCKML